MTITEACAAGMPRVRRKVWANKNAYLKIHLVDGGRGPWMKLYDREVQEAIGSPTPQEVFSLADDDTDDFEEYLGPLDRDDI